MPRAFRYLFLCAVVLLARPLASEAQFRKEAFTQNYNDDTQAPDSSAALFSFKEFFGGLSHTREARIGTMFAGSTLLIGGQQIYNRQYWKLPIIYGGIGAGVGLGVANLQKYKATGDEACKQKSVWCFAGAGAVWWASLLDGVYHYDRSLPKPYPGRSTLYSILLPGLGQVYNGEAWKVPIYWAGLATSYYFFNNSQTNYKRYRDIYRAASGENAPDYDGPISAETALYYRDHYRRFRDYSILAMAAVYLLQVIDANVFAYMQDFELSDDISLHVEPVLLAPDNALALHPSFSPGIRLGLTF